MAFSLFERSRNRARPVHLYLFVYGDGPDSYFAYTDAERPITFNDFTYEPVPIDRGPYSSSGTLDKAAVEIKMPQDLPLPEMFRVYPPSQVVSLIIRQGHLNDPDNQFLVCWSGRVLSCSREDNEAKLSCEPISTTIKRPGLRRPYQFACPHVLYGPECRANKALATTSIVPVSFGGVTITLPEGWVTEAAAKKYLGGMVQWISTEGDTVLRSILRVAGNNVFTVGGIIQNLAPGAPVNMILGCNHQAGVGPQPAGDCLPLHNNIHNFGGQMWIPLKSPFGMRSQYY